MNVIHTKPRPRRRWTQWQPLLAAASVVGIAFVLVQMLPRDRAVAPAMRTEEQVPVTTAPAREKQHTTTAGPATAATDAAATEPAIERAPVAAGDLGDLARSPAPPPPASEPVTTGSGPVARSTAEETASTAAPAMQRAGSIGDAESPGAVDRAARIAAMHAAGDEAGAADALRAFRAAEPHADDYLPESLRDWARTVE